MSAANRKLLALLVVPTGTLGLLLFAHTALVASTPLSLTILGIAALTWLGGAGLFPRTLRATHADSLMTWGLCGWCWWLLPGGWWMLWSFSPLPEGHPWLTLLAETSELWLSVALAGWIATGWTMAVRAPTESSIPAAAERPVRSRRWWTVSAMALGIVVYVVVFTGMNWGLWFNLRLPHGDSAMYEEHLWNLEHGKGFRSYLDQGLFLGEHIQVIHGLLVPLHWFWPSQLLLELCESLALALGAIPVFLIARRHSSSSRAALLLAFTYLLYFPLQYLDIAIDLKTFRPISFGVPLLLCSIDCMERRRYVWMTVLLLLTISAKEDFAIVICLLGLWLCATSMVARMRKQDDDTGRQDNAHSRRSIIVGAAMAVLAGVYLFAAVKVVIPWFRGGAPVHYTAYFQQFGETPGEILSNMLLDPELLFRSLATVKSVLFILRLLLPLALLPLLSPSRLLVGAPLLVLLCLNEPAMSFPSPVHHFHAPLLPILFWSAAAGLGFLGRRHTEAQHAPRMLFAARLACVCAFTTGLFWSLGPLGHQFWNEESTYYWRKLYVPDERARSFDRVMALIPSTARVASTDFVHPRFTHCERSYDYSGYVRAAANYEQRLPHDTDYVVIDIDSPYNNSQKRDAYRRDPFTEVTEVDGLIREPARWELLPETGNGYFLVLKRRE